MDQDANTLIIWILITTLIIAAGCFIAHYLKMRRYYSRFNRHSEKHLLKHGKRALR